MDAYTVYQQLTDMIDKWQDFLDTQREWMNGPNATYDTQEENRGKRPLSDSVGNTVWVDTPAELERRIHQVIADLNLNDDPVVLEQRVNSALSDLEVMMLEAQQAVTDVENALPDAQQALSDAQLTQTQLDAIQATLTTLRNECETAKDAALIYQQGALNSQQLAESYRDEAKQYRDEAQASADAALTAEKATGYDYKLDIATKTTDATGVLPRWAFWQADSTSSALTRAMPAAPINGEEITVVDAQNTASTNNITVTVTAPTVIDQAVIDQDGQARRWRYDATLDKWDVISSSSAVATASGVSPETEAAEANVTTMEANVTTMEANVTTMEANVVTLEASATSNAQSAATSAADAQAALDAFQQGQTVGGTIETLETVEILPFRGGAGGGGVYVDGTYTLPDGYVWTDFERIEFYSGSDSPTGTDSYFHCQVSSHILAAKPTSWRSVGGYNGSTVEAHTIYQATTDTTFTVDNIKSSGGAMCSMVLGYVKKPASPSRTVLYDGAVVGNAGTVTLSESMENFDELLIYSTMAYSGVSFVFTSTVEVSQILGGYGNDIWVGNRTGASTSDAEVIIKVLKGTSTATSLSVGVTVNVYDTAGIYRVVGIKH